MIVHRLMCKSIKFLEINWTFVGFIISIFGGYPVQKENAICSEKHTHGNLFHKVVVLVKRLCELNFLITNRIRRKWGWFSTVEVAWSNESSSYWRYHYGAGSCIQQTQFILDMPQKIYLWNVSSTTENPSRVIETKERNYTLLSVWKFCHDLLHR